MIIHDVQSLDPDTLATWHQSLRVLAAADLTDRDRRAAAIEATAADATLADAVRSLAQIHATTPSIPVLIRGLPVANSEASVDDLTNDLLLLGMTGAAGLTAFSYRQQMGGSLVMNVKPRPGKERTRTNAGRIPLGWHTDEAAFHPPYRAEVIALLCVDNTAGASTAYVDVADILPSLDPAVVTALTQHRYQFPVPQSFDVFGGKLIFSEPRPVLERLPDGSYRVSGMTSAIARHSDEDATHALTAFWDAVAAGRATTVQLAPGDLLAVSNVRGFHARSAVHGTRHLKRVYLRSDLRALRTAGNTEPWETVFNCEDFLLR